MRDFNDADRKKKRKRIKLPENPDNLSPEASAQLEGTVRAAVREGYVTCPTGWKIAEDFGVSRLAVGAMIDRIGVRVTNCQLGCFRVEKTPYTGSATEPLEEEVADRVEALHRAGELTCPELFSLARDLGVKPLSIATAANARGHKIRQCQLGCF